MSRKVKLDLHNHLGTRYPSNVDFNRVVDIASERLGQGGILGITNFNEPDSLDNRFEKFSESRGYDKISFDGGFYVPFNHLVVVKSQEVPTILNGEEVHMLSVGLPSGKHITARRSTLDTLKESKDLGGINVFDHPGYTHGILKHLYNDPDLLQTLAPYVDGWEIYNSNADLTFGNLPFVSQVFPTKANSRALEFWETNLKNKHPHIKPLRSSDGHSLVEIARSYSIATIPVGLKYDSAFLRTVFDGLSEDGVSNSSKLRAFLHAGAVIKEAGLRRTLGRF